MYCHVKNTEKKVVAAGVATVMAIGAVLGPVLYFHEHPLKLDNSQTKVSTIQKVENEETTTSKKFFEKHFEKQTTSNWSKKETTSSSSTEKKEDSSQTKPSTEKTTSQDQEQTTRPTTEPSTKPTTEPSTKPTTEPSTKPSTEPTTQPTTNEDVSVILPGSPNEGNENSDISSHGSSQKFTTRQSNNEEQNVQNGAEDFQFNMNMEEEMTQ